MKGKESGSWPTPRVGDVSGGDRTKWVLEGKWQMGLREAVNIFPIPTATERSGINPKTGKGAGLSKLVKNFPTPTESMVTMQDMEQARYAGNDPKRPKYKEIFPTPCAADGNQANGSLNPAWECWLMGYPLAWTDLRADYQISLIKKPPKSKE